MKIALFQYLTEMLVVQLIGYKSSILIRSEEGLSH